ncbi:nitroreductase family protein, partial [Candidatus Puniceispirillum sp.]|uniref:nitroreductase family protein n=1 Tax=Candidatus Puniceispirillum sp. TaxID=2026719 RepID=UPI001ECBEAD5|nr:nitroreductase [Candidatus Puniceispirillum sp.]
MNSTNNAANNPVVTFLTSRRSVTAKTMAPGQVSRADLDAILTAGLRVPDHGALKPWKLVVLQGDIRKTLDEEVILAEFMRENPDAEDKFIEIETARLQ